MPSAPKPSRPDVSPPLRIALLCATRRGIAVAERLRALCPDAQIALCSFPETPGEPRYLDDLAALAATTGRRLSVARQVAAADCFDGGPFDLLLAVSWRYIVRPEVYGRARCGAYVFHDSLLPKRRGFAPTPWAIIEGASATGVTLLEMAEAVDRGRIVDQAAVSIAPEDYISAVLARVTEVYLLLLERNLPALLSGTAQFRPQNEADATFGRKRGPEDYRIVWGAPAGDIFNLIRACSTPYPGAFCVRAGQRLTIWKSDPPQRVQPGAGSAAGHILERVTGQGARVATGDGSLLLREVQVENGPVTRADEILRTAEVLT
jgi:methionyl-tRNA formyltransferase